MIEAIEKPGESASGPPPRPPRWLHAPFSSSTRSEIKIDDLCIDVESHEPLSLIRVAIPGAGSLEGDAFRDAVTACYSSVAQVIREGFSHPIRFWNYVPGISRVHRCGLTGYELFNSGRFRALDLRRGVVVPEHLAVASAVGAPDEDFTLHVLASSEPASPIGNPRQIDPHQYSKRYGPLPPVFARACRLSREQSKLLQCSALVSGTASIVGEESHHHGDLTRQLEEVHLNLSTLSDALTETRASSPKEALARYRALRVYIPHAKDDVQVSAWLCETFPQIRSPELVRADLCRKELLVEIEGTLSFQA